MKVKLEDRYRELYTVAELDLARRIIKQEASDDECTARDWAEYAAREALRNGNVYVREVVVASAHTARNCRAWDSYFEGSGHMDVWVEGLAETSEGYVKFGAYLTDIWQTGAVPYRDHMYVVRYKEV